MADRALRVEDLRMSLEGIRFAIDLRTKQHLALLGVVVAAALSATIYGLVGQLQLKVAAACAATGAVIVLAQLRALGKLAREWDRAVAQTRRRVESLMGHGGEQDDDAEGPLGPVG